MTVSAAAASTFDGRRAAAADVARVVRAHRYSYANEDALQQGIAAALASFGSVEREVSIGGGRLDILVGRVAVEVKVEGSVANVQRQLGRYARSDRVDAIVLVTNRVRHLRLPPVLHGKPVEVVTLAVHGL